MDSTSKVELDDDWGMDRPWIDLTCAPISQVLLICVGGFLPAADGSLSSVATGKFWQQRAVRHSSKS